MLQHGVTIKLLCFEPCYKERVVEWHEHGCELRKKTQKIKKEHAFFNCKGWKLARSYLLVIFLCKASKQHAFYLFRKVCNAHSHRYKVNVKIML